jgi:metal-responsive CopG/Arc/MetJ family transcriptional regulator
MRTIALTLDDETLTALDRLGAVGPAHRSRSEIVRCAIREYAARRDHNATETRDAVAYRKHRKRLARDLGALVKRQAHH